MLLDILRAQYQIWGLTAPRFAWWAALVLLIAPIAAAVYLQWIVRKESRILKSAVNSIQKLRIHKTAVHGHGLSASVFSSLANVFAKPNPLNHAWLTFGSLLVRQRSATGEEQYWATDSAETAFGDAALFAGHINRSFFAAIPGIVTGTGLLFTFLAILVALMDLRIDKANQVQGLGLLIEGLSGKFVSSIAALTGATVFLLAEKPILHSLTRVRLRLVHAIDEIMPRLSTVRVLAELRQEIVEQTGLFNSFNAELAPRLKRSFSESVSPHFQRVAEGIDRLAQLMRETETQRKESLAGSLRVMLEEMQLSITSALEDMSQNFTKTLSRTTKDEFGKVSKSLFESARLLEGMNTQFQAALSAFKGVLEMGRSSATEQLALGRQQVDALTAVMQQLMVQMNDSAKGFVEMTKAAAAEQRSLSKSQTDALTGLMQKFMVQMNDSAKGFVEMTKAAAVEQRGLSRSQTEALTALMQKFMGQMTDSTSGLVEMTKASAAEQMERSKNQADDLTAVMRQLMVQMNDSAKSLVEMTKASSAEQMERSRCQMDDLASVMRELMIQMNETAKGLVEMTKASSAEQMEHSRRQMDDLAAVMRELMIQMNESAKSLVEMTKASSVEQMDRGRSQMDDLAGVMRQLMVQMNETARGLVEMTQSSSAAQMERSRAQMDELTGAMKQLMVQMNESAKSLVEMTKSSAADQMERGKTQADDLAGVMRQLMVQMNETAKGLVEMTKSSAAEQMERTRNQVDELTGVMRQLMSQMGESAKGLVDMTKSSAADQMERSKNQADDLTGVMRQLMVQMNEAAKGLVEMTKSSAADQMVRTRSQVDELTGVMRQLMVRMGESAGSVVEMARSSTAEQISFNKHQMDDLTAVMRQFLVQINESAGSSVTRIAGVLTNVVHELSANVSELQQKMAVSVQQNAEKAASAASAVVEQAGSWSARSAQQLDQLMKQYENQAQQMKDAEATLISVLRMVTGSLEQQGALTADLRKIATEVSATVTASAGATRSMEQAQRNLSNIAAQTALQLEEAHRAQKEIWTWIHENIAQYEDFFGLTENRAHDVLTRMTQNLGAYIDSNREGYRQLIAEADGQLAVATQKLGASVHTLTSFLQNLTDTLRRAQGSMDVRRS